MKKSYTRFLAVFLALIMLICTIPGAYAEQQPATPTDLGPAESNPDPSADEAADAAPAEPEKVPADLELRIGVEAVFTLEPGEIFTIRIPSKDGKMQIDAESEYVLQVEIKDEISEKTKVDKGEDGKPFQTFFGGHADRTYLLTVSFLNPQAAGLVRLTVTKFVKTEEEAKPAATEKPTKPEATEKPAEVKATEKPAETPEEKEEEFVEYNESVQTPVKLPANLLPIIFDESDLINGVTANATAAPKPSIGYYPTLSKPVVYISWTDTLINLKKADSYRLQRRMDTGSWKTVATRKASTFKPAGSSKGRYEYYDYNFSKGHVYTYRVQVIKSGKVKATSSLSRVSTLRMSKVSVSRTGKNLPTVKWTRVSNATGYYVFRRLSTQSSYSSKPYKTITSGSTVSFTDSKVTAGKTYYYLVVPFRKVGSARFAGAYRNEIGFFAGVRKPEITSVSQNNAGATIKWKAVTGATKYQVYIMKAGSSKWTLAGTVNGKSNTSFTHKKAVTRSTSGKYDQYKVRAVGTVGSKTNVNSAFSAVKKVYRLASPGTVKLSKSSTKGKIVVKWDKVVGAETYYVYYKVAGASKYTLKKVSGSLSTTIPATASKKNYVYVIAYGKNFKSQRTAIKDITPVWTVAPRYFALVIGNSDYPGTAKDDPGIAKNAASMKNALGTLSQKWKITHKANLSASGIKSAIKTAFSGAKKTDICLFYYCGHGDDSTGSYAGSLACTDGSFLLPTQLRDALRSATPGKVIVILDSCGSGSYIYPNSTKQASAGNPTNFTSRIISAFSGYTIEGIEDNTGELRDTSKFAVLTACQHGKEASGGYVTSTSINNHLSGKTSSPFLSGGAFTYSLITSMGVTFGSSSHTARMPADSNGDGKLTLSEACNGARQRIKNMNKLLRDKYSNVYYDVFDQVIQMYGTSSTVLFKR